MNSLSDLFVARATWACCVLCCSPCQGKPFSGFCRAQKLAFSIWELTTCTNCVRSLYDGIQQSFLGGVFPFIISLSVLPFSMWLIWILLTNKRENPALFDAEQIVEKGTFKSTWHEPIIWIGGLYILSATIGFIPALMIFFIAFFTLKAKTSRIKTAVLTAAGIGFLLLFGYFLNLDFPQGYFRK